MTEFDLRIIRVVDALFNDLRTGRTERAQAGISELRNLGFDVRTGKRPLAVSVRRRVRQ